MSRAAWLLLAIATACESTVAPPDPRPPRPPPVDAPIAPVDASIDAPLPVVYRCNARMTVKGHLRIRIDPATLTGYIERLTSGSALWRKIYVTAVRSGDELRMIFDRYDPADHTTIRGQRKPRPTSEKLVRGTSIVGRLVTVGVDEARMYVDGEVDWVTGSFLAVQDNFAPCSAPASGEP